MRFLLHQECIISSIDLFCSLFFSLSIPPPIPSHGNIINDIKTERRNKSSKRRGPIFSSRMFFSLSLYLSIYLSLNKYLPFKTLVAIVCCYLFLFCGRSQIDISAYTHYVKYTNPRMLIPLRIL